MMTIQSLKNSTPEKYKENRSELGIGLITTLCPILIICLIKFIVPDLSTGSNPEYWASMLLIFFGVFWLFAGNIKVIKHFADYSTKWGIALFASGTPFFVIGVISLTTGLLNGNVLNFHSLFLKYDATNFLAGSISILLAFLLVKFKERRKKKDHPPLFNNMN
jgi:hypothetical protein